MEYEQKSKTVTVPPRAGVEGFLHVLKEILKLPRVTEVRMTDRGDVQFWWNEPVDTDPLSLGPTTLDLAPLSVEHALSKALVMDEPFDEERPYSLIVPSLLARAQDDGVYPLLFVVNSPAVFRRWILEWTGLHFGSKGCFGFPLEGDSSIPDDVVVLLATMRQSTSILDTTHAFRTILPKKV